MVRQILFFFLVILPFGAYGDGSLFSSVKDAFPQDGNGACYLPVCHSAIRMRSAFANVADSVSGIPQDEADAFFINVRSVASDVPAGAEVAVIGLLQAASAVSALRDADVWIDLLKHAEGNWFARISENATLHLSIAKRHVLDMPISSERNSLERMIYVRRMLLVLCGVWKDSAMAKTLAAR